LSVNTRERSFRGDARIPRPEFHAHEPAQQAWKRQVLAHDPFRDRYGLNSMQITPQAAE
jgi:hypothetical protein